MNENKQRQEVSLVGRILSMEVLLVLMGVASLFFGIVRREPLNVLWGGIIIAIVLLLMKLRRKELERLRQDGEAGGRPGQKYKKKERARR